MSNIIGIASCLAVIVPFLTALILFKKINKKYYPFFYFLFLITISDLLNGIAIWFFPKDYGWVLISNINLLWESIIVAWIYKSWGLFDKAKTAFRIMLIGYAIIWTVETLSYNIFRHFNRYFCSFILFSGILFSVGMINTLLRNERKNLVADPILIICTGFIIDYLVSLIPAIFLLNFFKTSLIFKKLLTDICNIGVLLSYLIFAYAILLMAKQKKYINLKEAAFTLPLKAAEISSSQKNLV